VVAYYERQRQAAGIAFQTRPDRTGASIEASTEKTAGTVRMDGEEGGARVEVSYTLRLPPPLRIDGGINGAAIMRSPKEALLGILQTEIALQWARFVLHSERT